jgi:magnesium-protoporphyrin O-methyltransferase
LDIGGGIGAIQHGLLDAGVLSVTSVDASAAYIAAAREESVRRGYSGRVTYRHGDFVELSESIPVADIVTLDRVINVCPDWERVVALSAPRARRIYGLVHPQDTPFVRLAIAAINVRLRLQQQAVRASVIPQDALDRILDANGFALHFSKGVGRVWQVAVYRRKPGA